MKKLFLAFACCASLVFTGCDVKDNVTVTGAVDRSMLTANEIKEYPEKAGNTLVNVKMKSGDTYKVYIENTKLAGKTYPFETTMETTWCGCGASSLD